MKQTRELMCDQMKSPGKNYFSRIITQDKPQRQRQKHKWEETEKQKDRQSEEVKIVLDANTTLTPQYTLSRPLTPLCFFLSLQLLCPGLSIRHLIDLKYNPSLWDSYGSSAETQESARFYESD